MSPLEPILDALAVLADPPARRDWRHWAALATHLYVPDGVHAPSTFSAVLAAALPDLGEKVVLDAGCGAGLISIAALLCGARQVIACDLDPAALAATERNVRHVLGLLETSAADRGAACTHAPGRRLTLLHRDFRDLGSPASTATAAAIDIALANPPQRPAAVLAATEVAQRHLHRGGGTDGMDTIRLLLTHLTCAELWTTAASALPVSDLRIGNWEGPGLVHQARVPSSKPWSAGRVGVGPLDVVSVWSFRRMPGRGR